MQVTLKRVVAAGRGESVLAALRVLGTRVPGLSLKYWLVVCSYFTHESMRGRTRYWYFADQFLFASRVCLPPVYMYK